MSELFLAPPPLPLISRTEVHFRPPWFLFAGSLQGPVKPAKAAPELNDDAFRIGAHGDTTWCIVADGVGSAKHASAGAHYATYYLDRYLYGIAKQGPVTAATLQEGYGKVRELLASHAIEERAQISDYATTLLTALLTEDTVTLAKVGDGLVLSVHPAEGKYAFSHRAEPPSRDIDGIVTSITSPEWQKAFAVEACAVDRDKVRAIALATDGAETYFYIDGVPSTGVITDFAAPILAQRGKGLRGANPILQRMFQTVIDNPPTFNQDDRTFVIAMLDHPGEL